MSLYVSGGLLGRDFEIESELTKVRDKERRDVLMERGSVCVIVKMESYKLNNI